ASTVYNDANYNGTYGYYQATSSTYVGSLVNDRGSSLRVYGHGVTFYEDSGYAGRYLYTTSDWNDLTGTAINLHWGETWNDRISSFYQNF
ncbi:MAG: peptidase inhibitor family I36 protein, partial [Cellulosimicrobium cellulans]